MINKQNFSQMGIRFFFVIRGITINFFNHSTFLLCLESLYLLLAINRSETDLLH